MDDKILSKIKKCLALSESPEPAEAAAALRQAQKLMEIHGVSVTDLAMSEIGKAEVRSKVSVSRVKDWELALINLVAKSFGCQLMWTKGNSNGQGGGVFGRYILVGLKHQTELASYTCEVLQRKLIKSRAKFVSGPDLEYCNRSIKTKEADGFCHGWVRAIARTVHEFSLTTQQKEMIANYVEQSTNRTAKVQQRKIGAFGYQAGSKAAAGESLQTPVAGKRDNELYLN